GRLAARNGSRAWDTWSPRQIRSVGSLGLWRRAAPVFMRYMKPGHRDDAPAPVTRPLTDRSWRSEL
ncbi:MAG TPA: hypothetical protein VL132_05285, partial [Planctomycetaceae bacterium]|nr:hypothetical protein [Planctomycetaceae bacterium]